MGNVARTAGGRVRHFTTQQAIEWAFRNECAQLDLPDQREVEDRGFGFGTEYVLMQRMKLGGVRIDTSKGRSLPHDDAEIIASIVGGFLKRHMAVAVAQHAKAGTTPDWMPGAVPKVQPREWRKRGGFGALAKTEVVRRGVRDVVTPHPRNPARTITRPVKYQEEVCPIFVDPTPQEIERARKEYSRWWAAIDTVREQLLITDMLKDVKIKDGMPPKTPWKNRQNQGRPAAT